MPFTIRKLPNQNKYRVRNKETGKIHAKATTLKKAQKQVRLMTAIDKNPKFAKMIRQKNKKKKK